jgi:hypothetical protein
MPFCEPQKQSSDPFAPGSVWYRTAGGMQNNAPAQRGVCGEGAGQAPANLNFGRPQQQTGPKTGLLPGQVPVDQNGKEVPGAILRGPNDPTTMYSPVAPTSPRDPTMPLGPAHATEPAKSSYEPGGWYGAGWDGPGGPPLGVYTANGFIPTQGETRQPKFC